MKTSVRAHAPPVLAAVLAAVLVLLALSAAPARASAADLPGQISPDAALDLAVLRAAYPGALQGLERTPAGHLELVLTSGQRIMYDDGLPRDARQALEAPDIRTMLAQVYPLGPVTDASAHPKPGFDPGRARVQALFEALYGNSEAAVRRQCETVRLEGKGLAFNARHGAAQALARVWKRIEALLPEHPEFRSVLRPVGGTLAWRRIAGTQRLSMHSFGVAIDLNPHLPYWRNADDSEAIAAQRKNFPPEILDAFEAEGFIWGGKWASFDLMHFEYRPEIILKARALAGLVKLP